MEKILVSTALPMFLVLCTHKEQRKCIIYTYEIVLAYFA